MDTPRIEIIGLTGMPEIHDGDDLVTLILAACSRHEIEPCDGDVFVITQKIVSKAEGRVVPLATIEPSPLATTFGESSGKDPRLVELALRQARRVVKMDRILLTETHHGFICANSGVDSSNIAGSDNAAALPTDPDGSAAAILEGLRAATGTALGVLISDTFGRPWRQGVVDVAVGLAGVPALIDYRGVEDRQGRSLASTLVALADEIASAAELVMGKVDDVPVAIVRGLAWERSDSKATDLIRDPAEDLFR